MWHVNGPSADRPAGTRLRAIRYFGNKGHISNINNKHVIWAHPTGRVVPFDGGSGPPKAVPGSAGRTGDGPSGVLVGLVFRVGDRFELESAVLGVEV